MRGSDDFSKGRVKPNWPVQMQPVLAATELRRSLARHVRFRPDI
jgi:hypothetical protein